jgi:DNA polymerase-3 subunit epsilon
VVPVTWWTGAALGFDTETDGLISTEARIITGAMVLMTPGNPPNPMELMIQPERDIPQEAIDVHGITTERAREEGVLREVGIAQIAATIAELACAEIPVVGHNIIYDLTLLDREMRRIGAGWLELEPGTDFVMMVGADGKAFGGPFPVIDTLVLDKAIDTYRKGSRRLEDAAKFYGVPMAKGAAHGATADVIAALRIAITIANRCAMPISAVCDLYLDRKRPMEIAEAFYNLGALDLVSLHGAQVEWKKTQAEGLREYFRKTGTADPDKVSTVWPLQPLGEDERFETVDTTV